MDDKFLTIPTDSDTAILFSEQLRFGALDCVYQTWVYDGIKGSSLIFYKEDLGGISYDQLEQEIRATHLLVVPDSKITFSNNSGTYVFANFNFEAL